MCSETAGENAMEPTGLEKIEDLLNEQSLPPVDQWDPQNVNTMDLVIRRDGSWWYQGSKISRDRMVRLFSTVLRLDGDQWCLVTPEEKLLISVEDAPFLAISMSLHGAGQSSTLHFVTNVGDHVLVDHEHPVFLEFDEEGNPSPYVIVRRNLTALLTRSVYYQLVDACIEESGEIGIWSGGIFHALGSLSE